MKPAGVLVGLAWVAGCSEPTQEFSVPPVEEDRAEVHDRGPYRFRDATAPSGLAAFQQVNGDPEKPFIVETVGGGVALFDAEGDGDLDAYLTNGGVLGRPRSENPSDALFQNDGKGRFADVTGASGIDERRWSNGVRSVDLDADGALDLYVTNYGRNTLWHNDGAGRFEDRTEAWGVGEERWSTGCAFFDPDRDGDLDLYVANYVEFDEPWMLENRPRTDYRGVSVMKGPRGLPAAPDRFYRNRGAHMVDETKAAGLAGPARFGFQCVTFDVDEDGWTDLYVANDSVANALWMNLDGRGFEDRALVAGCAFSMSGKAQAGMGIAVGDYDGDGLADLFVTNFADDYYTVYRGQEGGFFLDRTPRLGLGEATTAHLGWGCGFVDFDSDGDLEIFAVNGHVYPQVDAFELGTSYLQENQLFELVDGVYREPLGRGGSGFALRAASRGAAVGDVDLDGDVDLLVGNIDGPPTLLINEGPQGNAVRVDLAAPPALLSGSRVLLVAGGRTQTRWVATGGSFLSSSEPTLHFGAGALERGERLVVRWSDGREDVLADPPAPARIQVTREGGGDEVRFEVMEPGPAPPGR